MTDRGSDSSDAESGRSANRSDDGRRDVSSGSEVPSGGETESTPATRRSREPGATGSSAPSESGQRPTPPARDRSGDDGGSSVSIEDDGILRWFLRSDSGGVVYVRDIVSSVGFVLLIALVLFGVSGVWPPLVAVESGSMEPNMQPGDMIFVVEDDRFVGDGAIEDTGIVTREIASETGHEKFGNPGDVIIFRPGGSEYETPVIHRAHFWVEEGERWVETKANSDYMDGATCNQLANCPAPYDGFVTKGDANGGYDQVPGHGATSSEIIKTEWVEGKASQRIPWLGHIRLAFDELLGNAATPERTAPAAAPIGAAETPQRGTP